MTEARSLGGAALCVAAGACLWPLPARAQNPQFVVTQSELYTNVTIIDGRGGAPRPDGSVLVWNGQIQGIGSRAQMVIPEGTTVVNLEGAYIVPGFIDAYASPREPDDLAALLAAGITAVREAAMPLDLFRERGRDEFGDDPAPRLFVGGPRLDAGSESRGVPLGSEDEAVAEVERQIGDGADFISIGPAVPAGWLVAIARTARRLDTPVWADRRGDGWLLSLRAGVDVASPLISGDPELLPEAERAAYGLIASSGESNGDVAWLERIDPEGSEVDRAIGAVLSRDATVVPLLASAEAPLGCVVEEAPCERLSEAERASLRAAWPKAGELVRALHREGVRFAIGSDAPRTTAWGDGFHREMQLLVDAGIPPLEVLSMATANGAIALGRLHERGTLEVGKRADFLVVDGDPVADIRNASRISFLVLGGRPWRLSDGEWERVRFD